MVWVMIRSSRKKEHQEMADTSERIIILSAVVLVIILWLPNSGLIQTIVTIDDLEVEIVTSRDYYTLGESFTANVYLVNTRSWDVWVEPIIGISFTGSCKYSLAGTKPHVFINVTDSRLLIPAKTKRLLIDRLFAPTIAGEFEITCSGVRKTVLILDPPSEGETVNARARDFDSIESRAEYFVKNLNLSDVGYEITLESENLSEALIYFRVEGGKIPIMTISHIMEQGILRVEQWTRHGASSPSRSVEIVDFKIKEQRINNQRVFEIVNPLVMNLGNGTAYVARIKTVVSNSSHTFSRTYGTVSKGSRDGLIGQGESVWFGEVMPGLGRIQDSLGEWHRVLYDSLVGETFTITITVYDGAGTALTTTSFIHKFQAEPDP